MQDSNSQLGWLTGMSWLCFTQYMLLKRSMSLKFSYGRWYLISIITVQDILRLSPFCLEDDLQAAPTGFPALCHLEGLGLRSPSRRSDGWWGQRRMRQGTFPLSCSPAVLNLLPDSYHPSQSSLLYWTFFLSLSQASQASRWKELCDSSLQVPALSLYGSRHPDYNFIINFSTYKSSSSGPNLNVQLSHWESDSYNDFLLVKSLIGE